METELKRGSWRQGGWVKKDKMQSSSRRKKERETEIQKGESIKASRINVYAC